MQWRYSLGDDLLVARYEEDHDQPADEVGDTADAEYDEVACGLTCKAHEREVDLSGIVEEDTGEVVDKERSETAGHTADTDDGCDGRFREHVTYNRVDVRAP